jgi:hypothetical protein
MSLAGYRAALLRVALTSILAASNTAVNQIFERRAGPVQVTCQLINPDLMVVVHETDIENVNAGDLVAIGAGDPHPGTEPHVRSFRSLSGDRTRFTGVKTQFPNQ